MAAFRIEKDPRLYGQSDHHLRDMSLSLEAKGLLSLMLSLPENRDYTMKGLARICKNGVHAVLQRRGQCVDLQAAGPRTGQHNGKYLRSRGGSCRPKKRRHPG